ncbi:MAG: hypothetical protein KDK26_13980 [Roseivivax sp.]|nr:hypothetical protein [Roseivivax sp.]
MPIAPGAAACAMLAFLATAAPAAPVQLAYDALAPVTIEDFESYAPGPLASPATFTGFAFDAAAPLITASTTLCRTGGTCLTDNDLLANAPRVFSGFDVAVTGFGLRLSWVNPAQIATLAVTVTGGSGSGTFAGFASGALTTALAFGDAAGLTSVTLRIADLSGPGGTFLTNYGADDVITAAGPLSPVPLPAPGAALALALALAALSRPGRRAPAP